MKPSYIPYNKRHWHNSQTPEYWTKVWQKAAASLGSTLMENNEAHIQKSNHKHVHFSDVTIREYEVIPSDNPAVAFGGPGIELGWNFITSIQNASIIDFDEMRMPQRIRKFNTKEGLLSAKQRYTRLHEFGFSNEDIKETMQRAAILRESIQKSVQMMKYDRFDERMENIGRFWTRIKSVLWIRHEPKLKWKTLPSAPSVTPERIEDEKRQDIDSSKSTNNSSLSC
jgi:hypothetical protein